MRHLEPLSGGLVTSRDPVVLAQGELSLMQNAIYRPGDHAIYRAAGRDVFGAAAMAAEPVVGIRDLKFDNGDHFLLALQGVLLSSAAVGDTGTFASATSFTGASACTALEAVQFNNRWHLFSGIENLISYTSATAASQPLKFRRHGLTPNTVQVGAATGAGTWTAGSTGYFEYWFTEVLEYTQDGVLTRLESTFAGQPYTLFASSTAMQATITLPGAPTNTGATKWILYRGGPKELASDKEFPTGYKLAEGTFGTATAVLDGSATTGAYVAATTTANPGLAVMTNPTNVFSSDNSYATHVGSTPGAVAAGFATFSVTEPIVGITVSVEGKTSSVGLITAQVSPDGGTTWSTGKNIPFTSSDTTQELGGVSDLWGLNWTAGDLVAGQFLVRVQAFTLLGGTVSIDQIRAKVTSAGSKALDESVPFPAIVISAAGVDAAVGAYGKPPVATTGDIFQGTLVTNSRATGEQALIRYSLPSQPDYFPVPYFLDFETPDNDVVTNLKTLNNRLGVFLASRLYRVNYLPTEADADFNRGICREEVSAQAGCVNAMCACVYEGPTGRSEIAFVSNTGIHSTDLFTVRDLTSGLDWRAVIAATNSTPIALLNDPEHAELLFFYKNSVAGSEHYRCLHLSYDSAHIRGGQLKISGPVHMRNWHAGEGVFADLYSAWAVQRSSGLTSLYMGYGGSAPNQASAGAGKVYIETGNTIPALDSTLALRTRRMYLAGLGNEMRVDRLYAYTPTGSAAQTITITPYTTRTNATAAGAAGTAKNYSWNGQRLLSVDLHINAEGLELGITQASGNAGLISFQNVLLEGTNFGAQDSGL